MSITAHGATFTFEATAAGDGRRLGSFSGKVTRLSVDSPSAEVIDATGVSDGNSQRLLVHTGARTGGAITLEYISAGSLANYSLVSGRGNLIVSGASYSLTRNVIFESCSESASVGDVVRGSARFLITDYFGN